MKLQHLPYILEQRLGFEGLKKNLQREAKLSPRDYFHVTQENSSIVRYTDSNGSGDAWTVWLDEDNATALIIAFDHESRLSFYPEDNYVGQKAYFDEVPEQFHEYIFGVKEEDERDHLPIVTAEGSVITATLVMVLQGKKLTVSSAYKKDNEGTDGDDGGVYLLNNLLQSNGDRLLSLIQNALTDADPTLVDNVVESLADKMDGYEDSMHEPIIAALGTIATK